jgi:hypothetical protein
MGGTNLAMSGSAHARAIASTSLSTGMRRRAGPALMTSLRNTVFSYHCRIGPGQRISGANKTDM